MQKEFTCGWGVRSKNAIDRLKILCSDVEMSRAAASNGRTGHDRASASCELRPSEGTMQSECNFMMGHSLVKLSFSATS
jgi:hypothetical protein